MGWDSFAPSEKLLDIADLSETIDHYHCLQATTKNLPRQARLVDEFMRKAVIKHKKTQQEHILDFSQLPLASQFSAELAELAHGSFSRHFENNDAIPLAEARTMMNKKPPGGASMPEFHP